MRYSTILVALLLAAPGNLAAQEATRYQRPDYLKQLPAAELRDGLGNSHMAITTASDRSQAYFDQGLSLMHDFWFFEAYRAFSQAARHDSTAVMPWWGVARALKGFKEFRSERDSAIGHMRALRERAGDLERRYVDAFFARDTLSGAAAKEAEQRVLEDLIAAYPDQIEAKLILVGSLGYRKPYARAMLAELLATHPDNQAAHHYWIHAWELDDPEKARASAERLAVLAPASGHIQHMPGHLFYGLGRYDEAVAAFRRADEVESSYMARHDLHPIDAPMAIHNRHYLVVALAEAGRYQEAQIVAGELGMLRAPEGRLGARGGFSMFYQAYLVPGKLELRFGRWRKAAGQFDRIPQLAAVTVNGARSPEVAAGAWRAFAHGMADAADGDVAAARAHADELEALLWRSDADESLNIFGGWLRRRLALAARELRGTIAGAQGDHKLALEILSDAVVASKDLSPTEPPYYPRLVHETYAEALERTEAWAEAINVYLEALEERPNSGFLLYRLARAHDMAGHEAEARMWYRDFLEAWKSADPDLPQVVAARRAVGR